MENLGSYGIYFGWLVAVAVILFSIKSLLGIVVIGENEIGQVVKKFSLDNKKLPDGRVVALNGEPGYQAKTLTPGLHLWYWPWMYSIEKKKLIVIKPGEIGLVSANDGAPLPANRIISLSVPCNMFQDAEAFLKNGGQKGKQSAVLTAGAYRINTILFDVKTTNVTSIASDKIGVVTVTDGAQINAGHMAAPVVTGHSNFQDPDQFIKVGGCRGLQEEILLAGQYNLNLWFATVEEHPLCEVPIGHVGVVVSFVGHDDGDISGDKFTHGNIVGKGGRGVWSEPLYPGKHPVNMRCMKVELVPTTNIVLNWAEGRNEAHKLDEKLSTITVRSSDGFQFNLDVSQIINIGAKDAPFVISRVGSVKNLVNQVLEPIIGNYFRNSAQGYDILSFLRERAARQAEARKSITDAIQQYNVQSVDTLIGDITPPEQLMKPLTDRKVAEEQKATYTVQMQAQETRKALVAAQALADKQTELVNEQQNIEIASRQADSLRKKSEGEAFAIKARGQAEADIISIRGRKEAESIEAVGLANAASAQAGVKAMGDSFAMVKVFEVLAAHGIKLVPDVNVNGNGGSDAGMMGIVMKLLSKDLNKV